MHKLLILTLLVFQLSGLAQNESTKEGKSAEVKELTNKWLSKKKVERFVKESPPTIQEKKATEQVPPQSSKSAITPASFSLQLIKWQLIATPILLLICLGFLKFSEHCTADKVVTATGLILVIQGTMYIITAATSTQALSASIGILGAIAGYLFGANTKTRPATSKPSKE